MTCSKCFGRNTKKEDCKKCDGMGTKEMNVKGNIDIPPGIANNTTLRVGGAGNYVGGRNFFGQSNYTDLFVNVGVVPDKNMKIIDNDVVSEVNITLLDALRGLDMEVDTVYGKKMLNIPSGIKNKEDVRLQGLGVKNTGGSN